MSKSHSSKKSQSKLDKAIKLTEYTLDHLDRKELIDLLLYGNKGLMEETVEDIDACYELLVLEVK
jgi:hypothetical protein